MVDRSYESLQPGEELPRVTNRIALIDAFGRLCTCATDGSDYRVLTRRDRLYQFPAWSPDGRLIAAVGSDRGGAGVYVFEDDLHGRQLQLYRSAGDEKRTPFYLYWSPDSQRLSFIANDPVGGIALYTVAPEAQAQSALIAYGQPFFWQWSHDSRELFIHAGVAGSGRLALFEMHDTFDDTPNRALPGYFQSPGISVDGNYLAYTVLNQQEQSQLIVETRDGRRQFVHTHRGALALSWSPTGERLVYMAPEDDATHFFGPLHLLRPGGQPRRLTPGPVLAFFWSPDGNKIAFFAPTRTTPIETLDPQQAIVFRNGHAPPAMQRITLPDVMRMELWVIDLAVPSRQQLFNFQPTRLFVNQFLPFFDQYALSHRIWAPDCSALVLPIVREGRDSVVTVPLKPGAPRLLANGYAGYWSQQ